MKALSQIRIFIIDDDKFYLTYIEQLLKKRNFQNVFVFESGRECLQKMVNPPDIVVLDYHLADEVGVDVMKSLRAIYPDLPIIFLTSQKSIDVVVDIMKKGANDCIKKGDSDIYQLVSSIVFIFENINNEKKSRLFRKLKSGFISLVF